MKLLKLITSFIIFISFSAVANQDVSGSKDHPLLSRYPDTHIIQYAESEYDEFDLPSGPNDEEKDYPKVINLEGKITTITYEANNTKTSSLQILKNYQNALNKAGFKEIYTCESKNDNCGNNFKSDFYYKAPQRNNYDRFWGNTSDNKFFFYSGVLEQEDNKTYVAIGTFKSDSDDETMIVVDVVEITTMKEDLIQTSDFSSAIGKYGKATLSGVLFDTGQASIKKESQQAIEYISNFLSKNPTINVFIVGHTDNTHTYDNNLKLSQQRAAAVVDSLIKKGIKKDRMKSVGIGPVSPVSTNATENGRALNRRVEMVLIK